ncbi:MAG: phosphoribosylanthranilate isomerase [Erythrobacter sp.]
MARIKICGISTLTTLEAVLAARADFVGFNFFPPSPRHVGLSELAILAARAGEALKKVGVYVDPDDDLLSTTIAVGQLEAIQLHGSETPQRAAEVRARFGKPVWKVLSIASAEDVARASNYRDAADFILFDAKTPKNASLPGGMGLRFDWSLLSRYQGGLPWGLAGGLTPENVREAVERTGAKLIDTSSGVESAPGEKDPARIAAFCAAARST